MSDEGKSNNGFRSCPLPFSKITLLQAFTDRFTKDDDTAAVVLPEEQSFSRTSTNQNMLENNTNHSRLLSLNAKLTTLAQRPWQTDKAIKDKSRTVDFDPMCATRNFLLKVTFKRNLARVSWKLSQFFFFRNKLSRLEHVLFLQVSFKSYFRKRLSKENFLVCHYLELCHPVSRKKLVTTLHTPSLYLYLSHYVKTWHTQNQKYTIYCNVVREWPGHR